MAKKSAADVLGLRLPPPGRRRELERIARQIRALPSGHPHVYQLTGSLTPDEHGYVATLVTAEVDDGVNASESNRMHRHHVVPKISPKMQTGVSTTPAPAVPTLRSAWPYWLWLLLTAVALYYAKLPILVIATIVAVVIAWVKFAMRFPMTALVIMGFLSGLMRGGRR